MANSGADKRKAVRVPVDFEVSFIFESREHQARALNLSVDGMFLKTEYTPLLNDIIEIYFRLPEIPEPLWMKARVAWGTFLEGQSSSISGIGVQFLEPLPSQREQLERYLQHLLKS